MNPPDLSPDGGDSGASVQPPFKCLSLFMGKSPTAWQERKHLVWPSGSKGMERDCPSSAELVTGDRRQPLGFGELWQMF